MIPAWAKRAFSAFEPVPPHGAASPSPIALKAHHEFMQRVTARWCELAADFLPHIEKLDDVGKQVVFEQALWVAKYHGPNFGREARDNRMVAVSLHKKIKKKGEEFFNLLKEHALLPGRHVLTMPMPSLVDIFEQAVEKIAERDPTEHYLLSRELRSFLCFARSHTGCDEPRLVDGMDFFCKFMNESNPDWNSPEYFPLDSRKTSPTDFGRMIEECIRLLANGGHPNIPHDFKLSNEAVAILVTVLFDLCSPHTPDAVKEARKRQKKR